MAETTATPTPTTTPTSTEGGGISGLQIFLIAATLLSVAGFGYMFYRKKQAIAEGTNGTTTITDADGVKRTTTGKLDVGHGNAMDAPAETTVVANTPSEADKKALTVEDAKKAAAMGATGAGNSPIRTNFDKAWNYQKRNGVWYTAKKDGSVAWTSLAADKYKEARAKLDAAYPND